MIRVLVVDDSAFMRRAVRQMLESDAGIEVVGVARNGREGVQMAGELKPDVITLDIEMPEMDGLTALRQIMRECPTQVLMLSSLTTEGSHASLRALKIGAADVLAKDMSQISLSVTNIQGQLLRTVHALGAKRTLAVPSALPSDDHAHDTPPKYRPGQFDVVCIGSSTGGPPVLESIVSSLPESLSTPIVIAQHMPDIFVRSMVDRFNDECALPVVYAEDGMALQRGTVHIAPGERHLQIEKQGLAKWRFRVSEEPAEELYRPSVNVLFGSAATAMMGRVLAVVMTGIGEDGLEGARRLHALGAPILAQSAETCVVYGMPKAVTQAALVEACLSPEGIAQSIGSLARNAAKAGAA